jgi:hypothetical protein
MTARGPGESRTGDLMNTNAKPYRHKELGQLRYNMWYTVYRRALKGWMRVTVWRLEQWW